jgi:predicted DNA-binding protein (MmcQ/YjbR family)
MAPSTPEDRRLARLTRICLALPEVVRERSGQHASFSVRKKVFAWYLHDHHGDGIVSVSCKTGRGENVEWVRLDPQRFYLPAYMGARGWIAVRLDVGTVDWDLVAALMTDSYRRTAPKRLAALVASPDGR